MAQDLKFPSYYLDISSCEWLCHDAILSLKVVEKTRAKGSTDLGLH
jgi:hypothetical protein